MSGICTSVEYLTHCSRTENITLQPVICNMKPTVLEFLVLALVLVARGYAADTAQEEDDDTVIGRVKEEVQKKRLAWVAGKTSFYKKSLSEKRTHLTNRVPEGLTVKGIIRKAEQIPFEVVKATIPKEFDIRKKWSTCKSIFEYVPNEDNCGACWAFATASSLSDRLCIASDGKIKKHLSAQDQISCMPADYGPGANTCRGFDIREAMRMFVNFGFVSGNDGSPKPTGCLPYTSGEKGSGERVCPNKCTNPAYKVPYAEDKTKGKDVLVMGSVIGTWIQSGQNLSTNDTYVLTPNGDVQRNALQDTVERHMMREIMLYGPITTSYDVYNDFLSYESGVYERTEGSPLLGGHAVRIIGWGVEDDRPYWLAVSSWGKSWGDKGMFKILRGQNHCNIERYLVTAKVIV